MNTENIEDNFTEFKLLNKKRAKSKDNLRNKKKKHKKKEHKNKSKGKLISINDEVKELKNLELVKLNYGHFFHIDWEDNIYTKDVARVGEAIDPYVYWFLINSSYFVEENIQENIKNIKEKYFDYKSEYINNNHNNINNYNNTELVPSHKENFVSNEDNLNMTSFGVYNKYKINIKIDKRIRSIMDYLNHNINSSVNVFGYSSAKDILNIFRCELKNYINIFHQHNEKKINFLENRANEIEEEFNYKNNIEDGDIIKWINDDIMVEKNKISYARRNKFINLLFRLEKKELLNQEYFFDDKVVDEKKEEEDDDDEYINNCLICNNCDVTQYSSYYECLQCNIKVHPFCYGIKLKTEPKKWKCDLCREMAYGKALNLECILCPNKGGAMKKTNIPKNCEIYQILMDVRNKNISIPDINTSELLSLNNNNNINLNKLDCAWIHLSCALWNKDVKFGNYEAKSNISLASQNIFKKYKSFCSICHKNNYGPTIKCKTEGCIFQCHPECGRINSCFMEVIFVNGVFQYHIYCHKHHPNKFAKLLNNIISYNTELIFSFDNALNRVFHSYRGKYKEDFYYVKKDEEINTFESPTKLIEDNDSEDNCSKSEISIKSDKYNKSSFRNKLYFRKKKYKKEKIIFNDSDESEHFIKNIQIETKELIEIKDKKKENEFIWRTCKINNNMNEFLDDKNININNIMEYKGEKNLQNILLTENTQSKSTSSIYSNTNISSNDNKLNPIENSITINNINNITNITNINNNYIKHEQFLNLKDEIKKNQESFIIYLTGFLDSYFKKNSILLYKGNGIYYFPKEKEYDLLEAIDYEDLMNEKYPIYDIHYRNLNRNLVKKYIKEIFTNEQTFTKLFTKQIEKNLKKLKKNEKFKNRTIICLNKENCIGKKNGIYRLLNVEQFKFEALSYINIPNYFWCDACLNNNSCDEDFTE